MHDSHARTVNADHNSSEQQTCKSITDSGFRIQSERVPEGQGDEEWPEAHHHRFPKVNVFEFLVLERVDEQERRQKGLRGHIETDSAWRIVKKKPGLTISR